MTGANPAGAYRRAPTRPSGAELREVVMATILWIIAAVLVISGIFAIVRKQLLWGIVLIVVGLLVGPGGVSIFH
jgi:fatty acid desaturase